ncbi:MAG: hypothetical protein IPL28_05595 [Chloroflexi bacterium]|nr:hypothetical protein [Chloroflexota bacterium]
MTISKNKEKNKKQEIYPQWYMEGDVAKILNRRKLKPYGIMEPLMWLATEIAKKN